MDSPSKSSTIGTFINRFRSSGPTDPQLRRSLRDSGQLTDFWWSNNDGHFSDDEDEGQESSQVDDIFVKEITNLLHTKNQRSSTRLPSSSTRIPSPQHKKSLERRFQVNRPGHEIKLHGHSRDGEEAEHRDRDLISRPESNHTEDVLAEVKTAGGVVDDLALAMDTYLSNVQPDQVKQEQPDSGHGTDPESEALSSDVLSTLKEEELAELAEAKSILHQLTERANQRMRFVKDEILKPSHQRASDLDDPSQLDKHLDPSPPSPPLSRHMPETQATFFDHHRNREDLHSAAETINENLDLALNRLQYHVPQQHNSKGGPQFPADRPIIATKAPVSAPTPSSSPGDETDLQSLFALRDWNGSGLVAVEDARVLLDKVVPGASDPFVDDDLLRMLQLPTEKYSSRHVSWEEFNQLVNMLSRNIDDSAAHEEPTPAPDKHVVGGILKTSTDAAKKKVSFAEAGSLDTQSDSSASSSDQYEEHARIRGETSSNTDNVFDKYHVPMSRSGKRGFVLPSGLDEDDNDDEYDDEPRTRSTYHHHPPSHEVVTAEDLRRVAAEMRFAQNVLRKNMQGAPDEGFVHPSGEDVPPAHTSGNHVVLNKTELKTMVQSATIEFYKQQVKRRAEEKQERIVHVQPAVVSQDPPGFDERGNVARTRTPNQRAGDDIAHRNIAQRVYERESEMAQRRVLRYLENFSGHPKAMRENTNPRDDWKRKGEDQAQRRRRADESPEPRGSAQSQPRRFSMFAEHKSVLDRAKRDLDYFRTLRERKETQLRYM